MKKRSWLGGIIALILIISVAANMGNEQAATEPESNDEDATTAEAEASDTEGNEESETEGAEEEPAETADIGEEVEVGDLAFTVNEVSEQSEIEDEFLDTLTTEGKFVVVDLTVYNNDSEARLIDGEMFRLLGSEETEYKSNSEADMYLIEWGITPSLPLFEYFFKCLPRDFSRGSPCDALPGFSFLDSVDIPKNTA
ncbi:DUF4352 domain-containing protein [Alteribacillus sp. HJP-4]|uniref:DUF4352 domain-containing protein n=1 Tax=Alteribacillus sp. HJP-4 TaxID=2775394 RepID=UPI0035CCC915